MPKPWLGRVHSPNYMRPTVWPYPARQDIIDQLSNSDYDDVRTWAQLMINEDDSALFETFKTRLHQHDQYRNVDFVATFPEMAKYL